ncbi:hypothetical protein DID88_007373 [Monilinia fructigena]|uniref:Fe2OG dioxygenase domain-containing protein n=1 Tax=Monilinia fructigena TaxID=38457 RepID=A0A395J964_9HELO|nr:hypothetical protein DID88_007373 [Monilinia fructigena]
MISLKRRQQRFNAGAGLSDSSILNSQGISVSQINESLGLFMNQGYSMQNEDGTWSDTSRSASPTSRSDTQSPPPTTPTLPVLPPRRATRSTQNVVQQPTMDQFFAAAEKSLIPTKRKAAVSSSDEESTPDATQESSEPPRKKATNASPRKPRKPAAPKSRKSTVKVKEQLPSLENATLGKPEAWGKPEVWADKRQQLCSALPYYKGYESAAYRSRGMISGFLCNQGVGLRDVFTEDIYITKVGGGKEKGEDGETKQVKDQDTSSIAIAFQRTMEAKMPVAIIAGQRNHLSPVKLRHHFNVLDFFHCTSFYYFDGQVDVNDLQYCEDFLQERTRYTGATPPVVRPEPITDADLLGEDAFGVEEQCKQGIVCPKCYGCIRRLEWRQWTSHWALSISLFAVSQKPIGLYDVYELKIPGETTPAGWIQVFRSNGLINSQSGGPDDLFQGMQKDDYKLRRGPARHAGLPMEIVTAHFASNWGAPYKFLVAHEANSFEDAPVPIMKAMQRMTWAGKQAFSGRDDAEFTPFNEVLCLGYFESMHIGYHDDGEDTLGETVATLSLGASSTMSFRPKAKSIIGGVLKSTKGSKVSKKDYVRVTLNHGDIIVMHGSGIHKYYEHSVTPHGLLRFALTCRYVKPELLSPEERVICEQKSALPANFADYAYDGNMDSRDPPPSIEEEDDDDDEFTKLKKYIIAKKRSGELNKAECAELRRIILSN